MIVTQRNIKSRQNGPEPWYEITVSNGVLTVDNDLDGMTDTDLSGESVQIDTDTNSIVAVTTDGELSTFQVGDAPYILRAHLAWFNHSKDELIVNHFVQ